MFCGEKNGSKSGIWPYLVYCDLYIGPFHLTIYRRLCPQLHQSLNVVKFTRAVYEMSGSPDVHCVSKKLCKFFCQNFCQISTNFNNFWQKDGKKAKIVRGSLIFHLK